MKEESMKFKMKSQVMMRVVSKKIIIIKKMNKIMNKIRKVLKMNK
jgi:hypothetical protein